MRGRSALLALALGACTTRLPDHLEDVGAPRDAARDVAPIDMAVDEASLPDTRPPDVGPDIGVDAAVDAPWPDGVTCPNGTCGAGEDDNNCPWDCGCTAVASCDDVAPFGCECDVCSLYLSTHCVDAVAACNPPPDPCGNGVCDYCENAGTCPVDC